MHFLTNFHLSITTYHVYPFVTRIPHSEGGRKECLEVGEEKDLGGREESQVKGVLVQIWEEMGKN